MNYYNLRRRNLISDILTPFNRGGYDIKHQGVRHQPIGSLHSRYLRHQPYNGSPIKNRAANSRAYTFVPPMKSIRQDSPRSTLASKVIKITAAAGLLLFDARLWIIKLARAAKRDISSWVFGFYRTFPRRELAALTLLVIFGLLWLAHIFPSAHPGKSSPAPAQLIPVRPAAVSNQGSSGGGTGSSPSNGVGTPQTITSSGLSSPTGSSSVPSLSTTTPVTGGMGGVGTTTTSGSGPTSSTSSSSSGLLPLTLTVPSTSTSVDNKTILDTSGTTLTVN